MLISASEVCSIYPLQRCGYTIYLCYFRAGGPAEYCQLEVGNEISSINGNNVAIMDNQAWLEALEDARKAGKLNMEVRKYKNNSKFYFRDPFHFSN